MLRLALQNLLYHPLRSGLAGTGLGMAVAALVCLWAFGEGYQRSLQAELDRMGVQLMLVPLGCPYDAAARVLKGQTLENSLPESALEIVRRDPAVAAAAPLLLAALPRPAQGRTDLWAGLDASAPALKPWWRVRAGAKWFTDEDSAILGCDAAEVEMRAPGDRLFSPETGQRFQVVGVLERSGTSDDSLFFVPLHTAQRMFNQPGRLTAVAIRLRDPGLLPEAARRLQGIPGAQVVTLTEMMGTFLNLVGAVRTLLVSVALLALSISVLGIFNTLMASVIERSGELAVMRAIGASPVQIIGLITLESLLLSSAGGGLGVGMALFLGPEVERLVKQWVPLAPCGPLLFLTLRIVWQSLAVGLLAGVLGGLWPAWRAGRLQPAAALKAE